MTKYLTILVCIFALSACDMSKKEKDIEPTENSQPE